MEICLVMCLASSDKTSFAKIYSFILLTRFMTFTRKTDAEFGRRFAKQWVLEPSMLNHSQKTNLVPARCVKTWLHLFSGCAVNKFFLGNILFIFLSIQSHLLPLFQKCIFRRTQSSSCKIMGSRPKMYQI